MPPLQLLLTGTLIVISDGIFEAPNPAGEQFGIERVIQTLNDLCQNPVEQIGAAVRNQVTTWQAKDLPADDQTIIIIRRVDAGLVIDVNAIDDAENNKSVPLAT